MAHVTQRITSVSCAVLLLVAVLSLVGCGGSEAERQTNAAGASLFGSTGCGDCHSLVAAGSRARVGPDLDAIAPGYAAVAEQVRQGGGGMPAFADSLSEEEIAQLAEYVSTATGGSGDASGTTTGATFTPDETRLASCDGRFSCMEQAFGNLVFEKGPKVGLAEFDAVIASNPEAEKNCHRIAHMMGAAALLRFDGSVGRAFAAGSASCWSGYYHGILERAFADVERNELGPVSRRLCADRLVRKTTFIAYQCVHGLGHGLMIYTSLDLPRSLRICDRQLTAWDQSACTSGVFMENLSSSYGVVSKWLRADDPIYPCQTVAERHKLYCYLMVTSRILPFVGYDFAKAARWCRKSEGRWVATCFQSLGRDASGQTRGRTSELLQQCRKSGNMMRECIYGAVRDLTSQDVGPRRSRLVCDSASADMREYCYEGIGTIVGDIYMRERPRRNVCAQATSAERLRRACLRGAAF
jgi:mono/diheme cytochrome c family protein